MFAGGGPKIIVTPLYESSPRQIVDGVRIVRTPLLQMQCAVCVGQTAQPSTQRTVNVYETSHYRLHSSQLMFIDPESVHVVKYAADNPFADSSSCLCLNFVHFLRVSKR